MMEINYKALIIHNHRHYRSLFVITFGYF